MSPDAARPAPQPDDPPQVVAVSAWARFREWLGRVLGTFRRDETVHERTLRRALRSLQHDLVAAARVSAAAHEAAAADARSRLAAALADAAAARDTAAAVQAEAGGLRSQIEILTLERDLLLVVVERNRKRVQAETAAAAAEIARQAGPPPAE